jgi:hypothetical protein
MRRLLIGAAAAAVLTLPSLALVTDAPPANACPSGMSIQNQSPLLGPVCAPNPVAPPTYAPPVAQDPRCAQYTLPSDIQVCQDIRAGATPGPGMRPYLPPGLGGN